MKPDLLEQLMRRALSAPPPAEDRDETAPLGFAARVVALAREQTATASWSAWIERRAWRALGVAGAVAALTAVMSLPTVTDSIEQEVLQADDPITALWDLS